MTDIQIQPPTETLTREDLFIRNLCTEKTKHEAAIKAGYSESFATTGIYNKFHSKTFLRKLKEHYNSNAIGLLPDIDPERIQFIGNSSLMGARMALLSSHAFERTVHIARGMTNIELSNYQPFMDEYVAAMFLPHTDKRLFPSVDY